MKYKPLNIDQIRESLPNPPSINYFETLDSTNSWLITKGNCGDICISESQTAGRGRRGNIWQSPDSGNIYFSICACFNSPLKHQSLIGLIAGIATAEALSDIGVTKHGVKWPNDIYWQDKKLGGILIETNNSSEKVVIGIGLNIHIPAADEEQIQQDIISLDKIISANTFSREQLIARLIHRLNKHFSELESLNFNLFSESWNNWDMLKGRSIRFSHQGTLIQGIADGLDEFGRIAVKKESGSREFFSSADIKLQKNWK